MHKITPFLWFDSQAEEAANFYVSVFKNSKIGKIARYPEGTSGLAGKVLTVEFELEGLNFVALNGGTMYTFTPAISLYVDCETQAEVDELWAKFSAGGKNLRCGWVTDKYGVTWQIIPGLLSRMLTDKDLAKAERVMQAMMAMIKIDVAALQRAYDGK